MSLTDPLADMFNRIRNANTAKLDTTNVPYSRMKTAVALVLKKEGFIRDFMAEGGGVSKNLKIYLKYAEGKSKIPVIRGIRRISSPGIRKYTSKKDIPDVLRGTGIVIVSTPKGVMSGKEARTAGVGGELLCKVW